jgi:hypothetical protein
MVRLWGMVLQVLGAITILPRLRAAQRQFPAQWWRQWWQRRPLLRAQHIVISAHGAAFGFSSGRARARVTAGPPATFEQRVAMLEENYIKLFDEVGGLDNELQRRTDGLSAKLQAEASAREAGDKKVEGELRETAVGTLHFDLWGVVFFISGTIAGTASPEIAKVVSALPYASSALMRCNPSAWPQPLF